MRDDPRARLELFQQFRTQLHCHIGQKVEGHYCRLRQIGLEQVLHCEGDLARHTFKCGVFACKLDQRRVEVHAKSPRAIALSRRNRDAPVA